MPVTISPVVFPLKHPGDPRPLAVGELSQLRWHRVRTWATIPGALCPWALFISCGSPGATPRGCYQVVNPGLEHL